METSTRTSEGFPLICTVCGKQMIVSSCTPLGDTVCPHCGALLYAHLKEHPVDSDDEKKLADLGILVETDDYGEIISAQLNGPRYNDKTIEKLAGLKDIPLIKLYSTALTRQGVDRLRKMLPQARIEEVS
ncbi:MAG: hypothetical protein ACK56W_18410 [Pirellula sp.]|jgi:hypothetical protein